jgi:hypothetical protein
MGILIPIIFSNFPKLTFLSFGATCSNNCKIYIYCMITALYNYMLRNEQLQCCRVSNYFTVIITDIDFRWKGRLYFKVYNPMNPCKYGIKIYVAADSHSGYCYSFLIYDSTKRTVLETIDFLIEDLYGNNYKLYMDNFYNSVEKSEYLLERGVQTTGTLRNNRGEPHSMRYRTVTTHC